MIPKIIHQLWIGPKVAPTKFMDSWRDKHPDFEYIRWSEAEFKSRGLHFSCQNRIDDIEEICGKADIIRWEILYHYGGIFLDADSICVETLNEIVTGCKAFAIWENEQCRKGLVTVGAMGFPPKHPLVRACIEWIQENDVNFRRTGKPAWQTTGPRLITRMYDTGLYPDVTILPSYHFLPQHFTGLEYRGHAKIFSHQEWGSTKNHYDTMNAIEIPAQFLPPDSSNPNHSVSILISSYNTDIKYINECLESIKHQNGNFYMEVVWINDGSTEFNTKLLTDALAYFQKSTRFVTVVYEENDENKGLGYCMARGVELCSNEFIFRMDSDDVMISHRILKQLQFMVNTTDCVLCGTQVQCFKDNNEKLQETHHPALITLDTYKKNPSHWFINHPSVCFRRSAVLEVGNYNKEIHSMIEDFDLWLRILKCFGKIHNIQEVLLYYRIHEKQLTFKGGISGHKYWHKKRLEKIQMLG